jgi:hypothetical protein
MIAQEKGLTLEDVRWLADVLYPDQAASYKQDFAEYYWLDEEGNRMSRVYKLLSAKNFAKAEKRAGLEPQPTAESEPEIAHFLVQAYRGMLETRGRECDILLQANARLSAEIERLKGLEIERLMAEGNGCKN